jgi:glycosyltransferase involved in cell wall biosynthesis
MNETYKISVIIPTYNRCEILDYTLHSLTLQNLPKDQFEVVVTDDGSSDNTEEVVESYKDRLNISFIFSEDVGYTPSSARNRGILKAQGEICLLVDCGVLLHEDCVGAHVNMYKNAKGPIAVVGYAHGLQFAHQHDRNHDLEQHMNTMNPSETVKYCLTNEKCIDVREVYFKKYGYKIEVLPAPWIFFWSCNVSVKRSDLLEINMFDEGFNGNWGSEDNDVGFRLQQNGIELVLCREAHAVHYPHMEEDEGKLQMNNCTYLNSKYNTPATRLFVENYHDPEKKEFTDINEMLLKRQYASL